MLKLPKIILVFSSLVCLLLLACATVTPRAGSDKVVVSEEAAPNCFKIESRKYISPPISIFDRAKSKESLIVKVKNDAVTLKADNIFIASEEESKFKELSLKIEFYSCQNTSDISIETLTTGCENRNIPACYTLAKRNQKNSNYSGMIYSLSRACELNDKKSCDWLVDFARQKETLKKACEAKDGPACLAVAKAADTEGKISDILGYLDQGCKLNHEESCFYLNYVREKQQARGKNDEERLSQELLINLSEESLKQPKIKSILAFLNTQLKD